MIVYRHADARFPFLWETNAQPPARWHGQGEGPVQYFSDTPDGAPELINVRRVLWAIELPDELPTDVPSLPEQVMTGGLTTYEQCRAKRLRAKGTQAVRALSAALLPGGASGWRVEGGLQPAAQRDGTVFAVFGRRPDLVGRIAAFAARPQRISSGVSVICNL